ncbi:hypothetical protein BH09MYX1_BH09MYX1_13200 [soil metagenome]
MRWLHAALGSCVIALTACSFISDLDPLRGSSDAGGFEAGDAAVEAAPPATGFVLSVDPPVVISDKGDTHSITVTVTRAVGFTDPITVALNGPPPGAGISQQTSVIIADVATSGPITFKVDGTETPISDKPGYMVEVRGTSNGATPFTSPPVYFGLQIGTLLANVIVGMKANTVTVPPYARSIDAKLWGGAGGGGSYSSSCNPSAGGIGGGGGFISAHVPVPGVGAVELEIVLGGGGATSSSCGGGGGGYSAVKAGTDFLIIAGGGGGGARNTCNASYGSTDGRSGHSTTLPAQSCGGKNATATMGGVGAGGGGSGTEYKGGDASTNSSIPKGGLPGGGSGNFTSGGGGGGGGRWGGGAGGTGNECAAGMNPGGGGGGSGFAVTGSTAVIMTAGTGTAPGSATDAECAGAGVGGSAGVYASLNATAGGGGRVIVRLTKTP